MTTSASICAGIFGLVLLLPALATELPCDSVQHHQQMLNSQILQLLTKKGATIPPECLAQIMQFDFPKQTLKIIQPHLAKKATNEILRGLMGIFSGDLVKTGWVSERLLNAIYAQLERLKRCFVEVKTPSLSLEEHRSMLKLRKYFYNIRTFLQEKSHQTCAGTIMSLALRTTLVNLDMLTKRMNS